MTKILVVDDEPDLRELVKRRFRQEIRKGEFAFAFAGDGIEGLELVKTDPDIDLVLTDINMPRMDGLAMLDHLSDFDERLKTIVVSAYGDMDNIRTAMNRGAFDFVTKPIDFVDLLITIKKSLDQLGILKDAIHQRAAAERAKANLARYFAPKLVETLADRDEPFGPPRQQAIGVLFADIRGFTTLSESMAPSAVMELLRDYHGLMEAAIFEHGGTLDSYIGDGMLATFGVPETGPADALNTLTCAREMLVALERWNGARVAAGEQALGIGIGIHYGPAVLGDIGSERAMAFAVIGDTVNTASRLQGLTRALETDLVASQALFDQAQHEAGPDAAAVLDGFTPSGEQEVRGRASKISVLTLGRGGEGGDGAAR